MKCEAYICDYCDKVRLAEEVVGIDLKEDLFDKLHSFPTNPKPEKCELHYCLTCYRVKVLEVAEKTVDRKRDEKIYIIKLSELSFMLRESIVRKHIARKKR